MVGSGDLISSMLICRSAEYSTQIVPASLGQKRFPQVAKLLETPEHVVDAKVFCPHAFLDFRPPPGRKSVTHVYARFVTHVFARRREEADTKTRAER